MSEQTRIANERELQRLVSIEDELARQRGHDPQWSYSEDGDEQLARAQCACGESLACRVFADGRVWSAGRLRVTRECVREEVIA